MRLVISYKAVSRNCRHHESMAAVAIDAQVVSDACAFCTRVGISQALSQRVIAQKAGKQHNLMYRLFLLTAINSSILSFLKT